MRIPGPLQILTFGLVVLIIFSTATAIAATNTVPATHAGVQSRAVTLNDLKPPACAGINVTNLITGSGTLTGTNGNDLIIGSSGADIIDGLGGDDCILGGGGDDQIAGGNGNDVCIGGPGNDTFTDCETQIQ